MNAQQKKSYTRKMRVGGIAAGTLLSLAVVLLVKSLNPHVSGMELTEAVMVVFFLSIGGTESLSWLNRKL